MMITRPPIKPICEDWHPMPANRVIFLIKIWRLVGDDCPQLKTAIEKAIRREDQRLRNKMAKLDAELKYLRKLIER